MRILHLAHQYLPDKIGGVERYTQSVAHALTARGHASSIFYRRSAAGAGIEHREEAGVSVWASWSDEVTPSRRFLAAFGDRALERAFVQALDEERPDLVHVQHLMGLPARLVDRIIERGIPMVVTLHDYWWVCANAQLITNFDQRVCAGPGRARLNCAACALARGGAGVLRPVAGGLVPLLLWRERLLRSRLQRAAALIAPTVFVKNWYGQHGIEAGRIVVLPHGIEPPPPVRPAAQEGRGDKSATLRFAYLGGLSWQKGVHVLVEAFNRFRAEAFSDTELWIAGDETADPAYAGRLRALAGPGVRSLGALPRPEVWRVLGQVDLVAVPSLWYETFSLIIHEAFAAGKPVVASRLGALAEVVHDGVDGLLAAPGDVGDWQNALRRFPDSSALRQHLCAGVRPPFTLSEHTSELEMIYAAAAQRCGRACIVSDDGA